MKFARVHEPSGEWHLGVWWINRPTKGVFSIRLLKWAFVWSSE